MIRMHVEWPTSAALLRRLDQMRAATEPGSRQRTAAYADLKSIVLTDHRDKMLRSVDRYGIPFTPLAASTLRNPKRGPDPRPLIPHGAASRFITNVEAVWEMLSRVNTLVVRFVNIVNKYGVSFAQYHMTGGPRLPRRDPSGITPMGWAKIKNRFQRFVENVAETGRR